MQKSVDFITIFIKKSATSRAVQNLKYYFFYSLFIFCDCQLQKIIFLKYAIIRRK